MAKWITSDDDCSADGYAIIRLFRSNIFNDNKKHGFMIERNTRKRTKKKPKTEKKNKKKNVVKTHDNGKNKYIWIGDEMNSWTLCIWNSNNLNTFVFAFARIHSHTERQLACRPDTHAHLPTNTKSSGETLRRRYVDRHCYRSWLFICYLCMPTWAKQTDYNLLKLTNHHKYLQLACFRLIDTLSALDSQQ